MKRLSEDTEDDEERDEETVDDVTSSQLVAHMVLDFTSREPKVLICPTLAGTAWKEWE